MKELEIRYREVQDRIRQASRPGAAVTLIAVSKKQPLDKLEAIYHLGQRDFGENYVQELVAKATELAARGCAGIRWHFIGHLQTNKVKMLLPHAHAVHTVDSLKLATELDKRSAALGRTERLPVFLEVNVDEEESKSGIRPGELPALATESRKLSHLDLRGLMCIPNWERETASAFRRLAQLARESGCWPKGAELSMGMSDDFESAIREGSTHVRIGEALFGPRS